MTATLDNLRTELRKLLSCCLHNPAWDPDDVFNVLVGVQRYFGCEWTVVSGEHIKDVYSDSESYTVVELGDGMLGLLEEGEDYTGHGCQCGSFTGKYVDLEDLLANGIANDGARELIRAELNRE